ncbi:SpaA isopeptide-forming pilin-related protein [Bacillus sp. FJAT-27916]|uniref:SpaA isopeptide-forming pilin-related protein n=1 Tax=Bacillus sp. FJAT-27916 TaxID=1679169 RepID=UPI0012E26F59|nr:SpaA isopeptide-forming pilin-related protein [Bacillus sp. FJAT-27916]
MAGVEFGVYTKSGDLVQKVETGNGGTVTLSGLAYGEYYAQETQGLAGYKTDDTKHDFTIASGEGNAEVTLQIKNKGVGSVTIKKTDELTGATLKGVVFEIKQGDKLIAELTTDKDGAASLGGLAYGTYSLTEKSTIDGYQLNVDPIIFIIDSNNTSEIIKVDNIGTGQVIVTKVDSVTGDKLKGVTFAIYKGETKLDEIATNSEGQLIFSGLAYGDYVIKEVKTIPGYELDDTEIPVTIDKDNQLISKVIGNTGVGSASILKIDEITEEPLDGVIFDLMKGDKVIQTVETKDGLAVFVGLAPGSYKIVEKSTIDGYKLDQTPISFTIGTEEGQTSFAQTFTNTGKGTIDITKVDALTGQALEGVEFGVYQGDKLITSVKTDKEGKATFTGLAYGKYELKEIAAPEGYKVEKTPIEATVDSENEGHTFKIANTGKGSIDIEEVDALTGQAMEGVEFGVYQGDKLITSVKTDKEGKATFTGLAYGKYELIEIAAPEGYKVEGTPIKVTINADHESRDYTIKNTGKGSSDIEKVDAMTGQALEGVQFGDYQGDKLMTSGKTDKEGKATFTGLAYGKYELIEIAAPEGYKVEGTPIKVTINADHESRDYTIKNTGKGSSDIEKVDAMTGQALEGVQFGDYQGDKLMTSGKTDKEGKATFTGLAYGKYELIEIAAPEGYKVEGTPIKVTINADHESRDYTIKNTGKGSSDIEKVDAMTGQALEGVQFGDYQGDKLMTSGKTDKEGKATFTGLAYGKYELIEIAAPEGYKVEGTPIKVTINADHESRDYTIKNTGKGSSDIEKVDAMTGQALEGVQFGDYQGDKLMTSGKTDKEGKATFTGLAYGKYELIEIAAPEGYKVEGTPIKVTINADHESRDYTIKNTGKGSSDIEKVDAMTGQALEGVQFGDYQGDKLMTSGKTDKEGKATFTGLAYGKYELIEIAAPEGYKVEGTPIKVTINADHESRDYTIKNTGKGSSDIEKVDAMTGQALEGVQFGDYQGDKLMTSGKTDKEGKATFTGLAYGKYELIEIAAPEGYKVEGTPIKVTINADHESRDYTIKNTGKGSSDIEKVDAMTGQALEGVQFGDYQGDKLMTSGKTDKEGKATFTGLAYGKYELIEIAAPEGYKVEGTPIKVTINADHESRDYTIKNTGKGSSDIEKVDAMTGQALEGVQFGDYQGDKLMTSGKTDKEGKATFTGLAYGKYELIEIAAPEGYKVEGTPIKVTINADHESRDYTIKNTGKGSSDIEKVDAMTGQALEGVQFGDYQGDKLMTSGKTDKEGKATFTGLAYGKYELIEIAAPEGYKVEGTPIKVTINADHESRDYTIKNTGKGSSDIEKVDAMTGQALEGVQFGDYQGDKLMTSGKTDKEGKATFTGLAYGKYELKEIAAPEGYKVEKTPIEVTVDSENEGHTFKIENTGKGSIDITKVDQLTEKPLEGVIFGIYQGETLITKVTTNEKGQATVSGLAYGDYQLKEIETIDGYKVDGTPVSFTVKAENESQEFTIHNSGVGSVAINKVDSETGKALAGAEFTIYLGEDELMTVTTDEEGQAVMKGLAYGEYTLVETKAPEGYLLEEETEWAVKIDKDHPVIQKTIENTKENPSLTVEKTTDKTNYEQGETVNYTIKVTNNGNIDLNGLTLEDVFSKDGDSTIDQLSVEGYEGAFDLAAGQTETFHASYVIPESDLGDTVYTNAVTVKNDDVTEEDEVTIVVDPTYGFEINKTADKDEVKVGETITYTIDVTNTGNKALTDINVVDEMVGLDEVISQIEVGETKTFTVTHKATAEDIGELTNVAVAKVTMDGEEIVHEAEATVTVHEVKAAVVDKEEPTVAKKIVAAVTDFVNPKTGQDVVNIFLALAVFMLAGFGLYYTRKKHKHE